MNPIVIVAPMPDYILSSNGRGHWRVRDKARTAYLERLDGMQGAGLIPGPPKIPFQKASIRSVMNLGSAMDDDNAMSRHKALLDWLKTRGYIVDDRRSNLKWEGFPSQIVKRNDRYTITLTISPISEAAA